MDGLLSSEALCEEGLITKKKNKPLLQKLHSRCIHMVHQLRPNKHPTRYQDLPNARGVGTRARIHEWFRRKHRSPRESASGDLLREGSSDILHFLPARNRFNSGKKNAQRMSSDHEENRSEHPKNAQHSYPLFHLSHPKIRLHFHSTCRHNSHLHPHLEFPKNLTRQKGDFQSHTLPRDVPKGFLAVYVGPEHQRFVIPVFYLNHPLFEELLKGMEEEFGYHQNGALLIPCEVSDFELLRSRIGRKSSCKIRNSFCRTDTHGDQDQHAD